MLDISINCCCGISCAKQKEKNNFAILLLNIFLFICNITGHSQTFNQENITIKFEHFTVENGLSQSHVTCLFQDSKGFLWIGTQDGLNRYDGYNFKIFRHSPNDSSSISNSYILTLFEDSNQNLWIGTNGGGLDLYIPESESFRRFETNKFKKNWLRNRVIDAITEDSSGFLWLATGWGGSDRGGGLYRFNPEKEEFTIYISKYHSDSDFLTALLQPPDQRYLWVGGVQGLMLFDKLNEKFVYYSPKNNNDFNGVSDIRHMVFDNEGMIWLATSGGLKKFDPVKKEYRLFYPCISGQDYLVQYITQENNNIFWLGTRNSGLIKFDRSNLAFTTFSNKQSNPNSISNNDIRAILLDKNGNLWAGGLFGGLNKFRPNQPQFNTHYIINDDHNLVNDLLSFYQDNDSIIWLGSFTEGLIKYNKNSKKVSTFKNDYFNKKTISQNSVWSIIKDKEGFLWVTTTAGACRFDERKEVFNRYQAINSSHKFGSSEKHILVEDEVNDLFLISSEAINKFDFVKRKFYLTDNKIKEKFFYKPSVNLCFSFSHVVMEGGTEGGYSLNILQPPFSLTEINYSLKKYNDNLMALFKNDSTNYNYNDEFKWLIIGESGNIYLNKKGKELTRSGICLPADNIKYAYKDNYGRLWLVFAYSGIYYIDFQNKSLRVFDKSKGYPFESVGSALIDDTGNLWISITGGLARFKIEKEILNLFSAKDGLLVNDKGELYKGKNGEIFLGANSFYPEKIIVKETPPDVVITGIQTQNRIFNTSGLLLNEKILLQPDDYYLRIDFSSLDFTAPNLNLYSYKLEGFDNDWINAGSHHYAVYTNLDAGSYIFRVRGSNSKGVWNNEGASAVIVVTSHWWLTKYAQVFYLLSFLSFAFLGWKMKVKRVKVNHENDLRKLEAEKLQELDKLKTRFFTNISHEFRTPLTLILGPVKQILELTDDDNIKEKASLINRNAKKLNKLADQLLDLTRIEAGKMRLTLQQLDLLKLLSEIISSFQSFAESKNINLSLHSEAESIKLYIDSDKIDKIMSNLLSNSLKFTPPNGSVIVNVCLSKKEVEISVADTGMGIPSNQLNKIFDRFYQVENRTYKDIEGTGVGLSLTKELVELHKGKISVESEEGKGSIFRLRIPLGKDKYNEEEIFEYDSILNNKRTLKQSKSLIYFSSESDILSNDIIQSDQKPQLLIIEDNKDVRNYISDIMNESYNISTAVNGKEGLSKSVELIPDLIISDIMMPEMDGIQVCSALKNNPLTSHIPVILLTAKSTIKDKIDGLNTGADSYIIKPFEPEELKARIKNLLEQRKRIQEYFKQNGIFELAGTKITSADKKFLNKINEIINEHISDTSLCVEMLADNLSMSRSLLHKKLSTLIGESPGDLIRRIRLKKAAKLIEQNYGNITEIAFESGFNDPAYFAVCFKKQFGVSPSHYKNHH